MIKFIIPVFFFHFFMICDLCAQVDTTHKNIVSISPLCLINQTISLSYTRQLNKTFDIEINPRIRIQPYKNLDNCVYANGWIVYHSNNPYWYYNKYTLRLSVLYHLKWIYIEPIYQFEYGYFKNQTINYVLDPPYGVSRMNRSYISNGLDLLGGYLKDFKNIRLKPFLGIGCNYRQYNETIFERIDSPVDTSVKMNTQNTYSKFVFSFLFGIEVGFKFR